MVEMFEVSREEITADAGTIFLRLHPDDKERVLAAIEESGAYFNLYYSQHRVILPGKGVRWYIADSRPQLLEDGSILWTGFVTDITERKRTEDALRESELRFRQIFEQSRMPSSSSSRVPAR